MSLFPVPPNIFGATAYNDNPVGAPSLYEFFLTANGLVPPPGVAQIGPFEFDDAQDDTVDMRNEITDHWVEDNVAVQDHIGVKADEITLRGSVSELTMKASTSTTLSGILATAENGLSQVPAYLGKYSPGVTDKLLTAITQVQNVVVQIQQAAARVAQIANLISSIRYGQAQTRQQAAFAMLGALRNARILFTVNTPFAVYYNMAITSFKMSQPRGSRMKSDITVSLKQLQFVNSISQSSFMNQYGNRAAFSYQPKVANGSTRGAGSSVTAAAAFL